MKTLFIYEPGIVWSSETASDHEIFLLVPNSSDSQAHAVQEH